MALHLKELFTFNLLFTFKIMHFFALSAIALTAILGFQVAESQPTNDRSVWQRMTNPHNRDQFGIPQTTGLKSKNAESRLGDYLFYESAESAGHALGMKSNPTLEKLETVQKRRALKLSLQPHYLDNDSLITVHALRRFPKLLKGAIGQLINCSEKVNARKMSRFTARGFQQRLKDVSGLPFISVEAYRASMMEATPRGIPHLF
jgi:hypothetical protein